MTLEIDVLTLFPAMVEGPLAASIPGRIQERGIATVRTHDLREWGLGRHRSVDDAPYGGGAGMVMRPEPIAAALDALRRPDSLVDPARPGRRACSARRAPTTSRRAPTSSSSARATRASTSGSAASSTSSCRSATTS